ncbi:MAG TPA: hypothetical protein ENK19_10045 [Acidobacteria bacterium]|nr:hypothetical protein [Acidobacteriota bacterium]
MGGFTPGAWTTLASAVSVAAGGTPVDLGSISLSGTTGVEIAVEWTYGAGATKAGRVLCLRQTSGTPTWQDINDNPYEVPIPAADGVAREKVFPLDASRWPDIKLQAVNDEATIAATVSVRYRTITYA